MVSDDKGEMTNIARYYHGHCCTLYSEQTPFLKKITAKLGDLNDTDFANLELFKGRITRVSNEAATQACKLYVDAEQTFIQGGIDSFAQ